MKAILNLFCLIISLDALGQNVNTVRKKTARSFMIIDAKPINKHDRPLYVMDGIIFKGNIKKINSTDIQRINVLNPPGSINIYGKQGKYGVIFITTKYQVKSDITKEQSILPIINTDTVYLIDGILSTDEYSKITPTEILSVYVLKNAPDVDKSLADPNKITVIITTKKYAISEYQKKLSAFSNDYQLYLKNNKNEDDQLLYVINGIPVQGAEDKILKTLYGLTVQNIKKVFFLAKFDKEFNNKVPIVVITATL